MIAQILRALGTSPDAVEAAVVHWLGRQARTVLLESWRIGDEARRPLRRHRAADLAISHAGAVHQARSLSLRRASPTWAVDAMKLSACSMIRRPPRARSVAIFEELGRLWALSARRYVARRSHSQGLTTTNPRGSRHRTVVLLRKGGPFHL